MKLILLNFLIIFLTGVGFAQGLSDEKQEKVDSLQNERKNDWHDTVHVEILFEIANEFYLSNQDTAIYFCKKAQEIAIAADYQLGIANSYSWLGYLHWQAGELDEALSVYKKGLKANLKTNDTADRTNLLNNIGWVYKELGDLENSLTFLHKALKLGEEAKDNDVIAHSLNNIGAVHKDVGEYDLALKYFKDSYQLRLEADDHNVANVLNNIATIYGERGEGEKAIDYYTKSLQASVKKQDKKNIAMTLINIGTNYQNRGFHDSAWIYLNKGLIVSQEMGSLKWESRALIKLGEMMASQKKWSAAKGYLLRSYELAKDFGSPERLEEVSEQLYQIYQHEGNWEKAFFHHLEFVSMHDSVVNEKNKKEAFKQQINYEYEHKKIILEQEQEAEKALLKKEQEQLIAINKKEQEKKNIIILGVSISLGLIILFSIITFNRLRITKKQKVIIEEQSNELSIALDERSLLLKEIHHRVKNNLQTVSSLLNLQSRYLKDEQASSALEESQNRILSISLLHQKLYQSDNVPIVEFSQYVEELTDRISATCNPKEKDIQIKLDCEELICDIDLAMPLGLIINELITNSYKYAFDKSNIGEIFVSLKTEDKVNYQLEVADSGIGIPPDLLTKKFDSMGINLVKLLTRQIKGKVRLEGASGAHFFINFEKK